MHTKMSKVQEIACTLIDLFTIASYTFYFFLLQHCILKNLPNYKNIIW